MVEVSLQSKSRQQYADVRSYVPYHDWKPGGGIPLQAGYGHSLNQITLPHRGLSSLAFPRRCRLAVSWFRLRLCFSSGGCLLQSII